MLPWHDRDGQPERTDPLLKELLPLVVKVLVHLEGLIEGFSRSTRSQAESSIPGTKPEG